MPQLSPSAYPLVCLLYFLRFCVLNSVIIVKFNSASQFVFNDANIDFQNLKSFLGLLPLKHPKSGNCARLFIFFVEMHVYDLLFMVQWHIYIWVNNITERSHQRVALDLSCTGNTL